MDEDKFTLAWNDFASNAVHTFAGLRKDPDFSDITLACGDGTMIKAHKVVLASCSPVFRKLFQQYNHSNPLIILRGLNKSQLENIIDYAYFGQIEVELTDLEAYLEVAEEFKLKGLTGLNNSGIYSEINDNEKKDIDTKAKEEFVDSKENKEVPNDFVKEERIQCKVDVHETKTAKKLKMEKNNDINTSFSSNAEEKETLKIPSVSFQSLQELINTKVVKLDDPKSCNDYKCSDCGKEFSSKNKTSLKSHIEAFHVAPFQEIKLECSYCQKVFNRTRPFTNHFKVCANK